MITGIDIKEKVEFISRTDKSENPTIWILGALTKREILSLVSSSMNDKGEVSVSTMRSKSDQIVKTGLKGVKNYKIGKNDPKDFDVINDDLIDSLPIWLLNELATKIISINFVSEEEEKN